MSPRPAATVVVFREAGTNGGFDVLMVRRHDQVAFMGGAYVFPGGRVDDSDADAAATLTATTNTSRFADLTTAREMAYRAAAVRELEEEAGLRVDPDDLVPFAHWVTPEIETRRYDTRFFAVRVPPDQHARHDGRETTDLVWLPPAEAIARSVAGEILLPPPTWTTLKRFARFASVADALAWARSTRIVTIQPGFHQDGQQAMLTLPGDPAHPAIDGWDVPEDTRFLLRDGRWQPVPTR